MPWMSGTSTVLAAGSSLAQPERRKRSARKSARIAISTDEVERVLDAVELGTRRHRASQGAELVRDDARAEERSAVVDGADVGLHLEQLLEKVELVVGRLGVTEDTLGRHARRA